jgi:hypothetical protein
MENVIENGMNLQQPSNVEIISQDVSQNGLSLQDIVNNAVKQNLLYQP